MDETRPADRAEAVLKLDEASGDYMSAAGFTSEDQGADVSIDGDNVVVTRRGRRGEKISEHALSVRWATPPPSSFEGGTITSVDPAIGGKVVIEAAEVVLTNPRVKIRRVFLWPNSFLDGACTEDGGRYQIVAHRHCQEALDRFFIGRYPGSSCMIEPYVGLQEIFLQAMLPFLSIVHALPPDGELQTNCSRQTDVGGGGLKNKSSLRNEFIKDCDLSDGTDPQLKAAMREVRRAAAKANGRGQTTSGGDHSEETVGSKGGKGAAGLYADMCEAISNRLGFYMIPKVKMAMWFASHVLYTLLLTHLGIYFSEDQRVWQHTAQFPELLFYVWSGSRLLSEAAEFGSFSTFGGFMANLKDYLGDPWNKLDAAYNLFVVSLIALRLYMGSVGDEADGDEGHWVATLGCNQFALMIVLCWFRMLQFLGYYQSTGVLQIVLGDMMNDIMIWTVLSAVISLGFAFAFVVLLPGSSANHSWSAFLGLHPVYETIWLWVGAGVHSDRATMEEVTGSEMPTSIVMPTLMWIYQFVIGVLLVNLLIAMMSDT